MAGPTNRGFIYEVTVTDNFTPSLKKFNEGIEKNRQVHVKFQGDLKRQEGLKKATAALRSHGSAMGQWATKTRAARDASKSLGSELGKLSTKTAARSRSLKTQTKNMRENLEALKALTRNTRSAVKPLKELNDETARMAKLTQGRRAYFEAEKKRMKELGRLYDTMATKQRRATELALKEAAAQRNLAQSTDRANRSRRRSLGAGGGVQPGAGASGGATSPPSGGGGGTMPPVPPVGSPGFCGRLASMLGAIRSTTKEMFLLDKTGKDALFTFRRLIGIFAVFTAARMLITGFRALVQDTVRFSANIETAHLGIAAIITASTRMLDLEGKVVNKAEQFARAKIIAADQAEKLRVEALKTAATYDQILEAYQIGLGPGFAAGMTQDQVRNFAVRVSQAAGAIGLPQNQLNEEIRSVLAGTIQKRTTRIAATLGISNEDIRRAKELGMLYEFLMEKFSAFGVAGEETLLTWNAIVTNTKDAILLLLSTGMREFFEEIKSLLMSVKDSVTEVDEVTGRIKLNPQALEAVGHINRGLVRAIAAIKEFGRARGMTSFNDIAKAIGESIGLTAEILTGVVSGFVDGAKVVWAAFDKYIIQPILSIKSLLGDEIPETTQGLAHEVTKFWVKFTAVSVAVSLIGTLLIKIGTVLSILSSIVKVGLLKPFMLLARQPLFWIITGFALLLEGIKRIASRSLGLALTWKSFGKILLAAVTPAMAKFVQLFERAVASIRHAFARAWLAVGSGIKDSMYGVAEAVLGVIARFSDAAKGALAEVRRQRKEALQDSRRAKYDLDKELADAHAKADEKFFKAQREFWDKRAEIIAEQRASEAEDAAESAALEGYSDLLGNIGMEAAVVEDELDWAPTMVGNLQSLEQFEKKLEDLRDSAAKERVKLAVLGYAGLGKSALMEQRTSALDIEKELRPIQGDLSRVTSELEGATRLLQEAEIDLMEIEFKDSFLASMTEALGEAVAYGDKLTARGIMDTMADMFDPATAQAALDTVKNYLDAQSRVQSLTLQQKEAKEAILDLDKAMAELSAIKVVTSMREATQAAQDQYLISLAQYQNMERMALLERQRVVMDRSLREKEGGLQGKLQLLQAEMAVAKAQSDRELAGLRAASEMARSDEERKAIEEAILQIQKKQTLERAAQLAELEQTKEQLRILQERQEDGLGGMFEEAMERFANRTLEYFETTVSMMESIFTKFSDFLADSLIEALDPTSDASFKDRLRTFLQDIFREITRMYMQLAIAKMMAGFMSPMANAEATGAAWGGVGFPGEGGFHAGGKIPGSGKPSFAHRFAEGYAYGGRIRRHPNDTTPIWAEPGEFMQPVASVNAYGLDFMRALQHRTIPPSALRAALSGPVRARASRPASVPVAGGSGGERGQSGGFVPTLVIDDAAAERIMRSAPGRRVLQSMLHEERDLIRSLGNRS